MKGTLVLLVVAFTAPVAAAVPLATSKSVLVAYHETGGPRSVDRSVAVRRDGRVTASSRRPVVLTCVSRLAPAQLASLRRALREARFGSLNASYEHGRPVADVITYRTTYAGRTIRAEAGSEPARLERVADRLRRMLDQRLALCRKLGR